MAQPIEATEVRVEVTVEVSCDAAFGVFIERCHEWWPSTYRLGAGERTYLQIEPHVGGRWYEVTADGGQCDWGQVMTYEPGRHLVLGWQIAINFVAEPDPDRASRVDVRFGGDGLGGTRVTLVHSELSRHGEGWQSMREAVGSQTGWPGIMESYRLLAAAAASAVAGGARTFAGG